MQAYETGLQAGDTRLVLSPNSDFFRYFNDPTGPRWPGRTPPAGPPGGHAASPPAPRAQ